MSKPGTEASKREAKAQGRRNYIDALIGLENTFADSRLRREHIPPPIGEWKQLLEGPSRAFWAAWVNKQESSKGGKGKKGYRGKAKQLVARVKVIMDCLSEDERGKDTLTAFIERIEASGTPVRTLSDVRWLLLCFVATLDPQTDADIAIAWALSDAAKEAGITSLKVGSDMASLEIDGKPIKRETLLRYFKGHK